MPNSMLDLSLDNLDEIKELLTDSFEQSMVVHRIFDFNDEVQATPENRQKLNALMDRMGGYLKEISHIDSFLQYTDLTNNAITAKQQENVIECQQLCKKIKNNSREVMHWVAKVKAQFNDESCPVIDDLELNFSGNKSAEFVENETIVSPDMIQTYDQLRAIFKDIHPEILFTDPEAMTNAAGRRLEVMSGKTMFIETEHEMDLVVDYGLFQYRKNGKNVVERYCDAHQKLYSGAKLDALIALKNARFSLLKIIKPIHENGTVVFDALKNETLILIDRGIHNLAKSRENYAILTHYLIMPGFIMTTGVSTPVNLSTPSGEKMQEIFERLIRHCSDESKLDQASYFQCITDLFKTAIHENITKTVASKNLPMNYHQHSQNCRH